MSFLVDTDVLSELLRAEPAPPVQAWFVGQESEALFVSAVTQAEMMSGARLLPAGRRRERLVEALHGLFGEDFGGRILPFDHVAAAFYAEVVTARREAGRPISQFDAQIAATALAHGLAVVTRNTGDFEGVGASLLDPWR